MIAAIDHWLRGVRDGMTPGQRWTAALALGLATAVLGFGLPHRQVFELGGAALSAPPVGASDAGREETASDRRAAASPVVTTTPIDVAPGAGTGRRSSSRDTSPTPTTTRPASTASATPIGENGSCEVTVRSVENPRRASGTEPLPVWIFEPAGSGAATATGGRCGDDERPGVLFAHGFGNTDPAVYEALVHHLVSVGNVVVYPTYEITEGDRADLEESYRVTDAGLVAGVDAATRIDTGRIGWWGHSHGGGMVPYLVQQGTARGWGSEAAWMSIVAQAYSQLVGAEDIAVPAHVHAISVAFQHDALADARLGNDVFTALTLPADQRRHVTVMSDPGVQPPFVAEHGAPTGSHDEADAVDHLLWRYADLLERCALHGVDCDADFADTGTTAGGDEIERAVVSQDPVDIGPYPAVLAECDAVFGPTLNPRIERCGETRI